MDPEHLQQAERLTQYRNALAQHHAQGSPIGTSFSNGGQIERQVNGYALQGTAAAPQGNVAASGHQAQDPMIYPGLYAPSGFDIMSILVRVAQRPNPTLSIGHVDSGVALLLCDTALPDMPVVYCSEAFCTLTGYSEQEILGRNCRFLQKSTLILPDGTRYYHSGQEEESNKKELATLRTQIAARREVRVELVNYKKDGTKFVNLLTIIPVSWDPTSNDQSQYMRYIVGFQAEERMYNPIDPSTPQPPTSVWDFVPEAETPQPETPPPDTPQPYTSTTHIDV